MLLAGLGNPGQKYARTRHNAGFLFAELVRSTHGLPTWKKQGEGLVSKGKLGGVDIVLLQPQTYMNLSGSSVQAALRFYKLKPEQLFVAHDELDIALGKLKYKQGGGDAGHNGLKSITQALGTPNYHRLRLGIGRPTTQQPVEDYVVQAFSADERAQLDALLERMAKAMPQLLENPLDTLAKLGNSTA